MSKSNPKISICIPIHETKNTEFFLERLQNSIEIQSFTDFEVIVTKKGRMAENTNASIKKAKGDLIKILFMDDFLADENSLKDIVNGFTSGWLVSGCLHVTEGDYQTHSPHLPVWNDNMFNGINTIGSPSVLTMENNNPLLMNEDLDWMIDCEYYMRLYERYGQPTYLNTMNVVIGLHDQQMTHLLSDEVKKNEHQYMLEKHGKSK